MQSEGQLCQGCIELRGQLEVATNLNEVNLIESLSRHSSTMIELTNVRVECENRCANMEARCEEKIANLKADNDEKFLRLFNLLQVIQGTPQTPPQSPTRIRPHKRRNPGSM